MINDLMADIQRSLGRIEQKVDSALAWQTGHAEEDEERHKSMRDDIQALQITRAKQSGKQSVIAALFAAAAGGIGGVIDHLFWHSTR